MSKSDKESLTQDMKEALKEQAEEANNMKKDTENKEEHSVERKKKKKEEEEPQLPVSEPPKSITFHSSDGSFASDEVPHHAAVGPVVAAANRFAHEVEPDHHKIEEGMVGGGSSGFLMSKKEAKLNKALLGLRISGLVFCLVSFSVMADIRKKGVLQTSFYDFVEFKYALSMNVIGFVYSGVQIVMMYLITDKHTVRPRCFNFVMDQALTYLLLSASTSAATVARDFWKSTRVVNKFIESPYDDFIEMANASVALSFFAFKAFALATLISGYMLFGFKH